MNFKTALFLTLPLALFGCPDDTPTSVTPVETAETGDTDVTPLPDPTFDIVLADGDGESDVTGGADDDTLTLTITNTPEGAWEFGYAQTQSGDAGWYGEACDLAADYCHPIPAADAAGVSTLVLTRVEAISGIVEGSTMLLPVDMPVTGTPDLTYYVGTVATDEDTCVVWGDDPSYYMTLGCVDPGTRGTTNDN